MPIKYIGAILIFASCGTMGFLKSAKHRREERCLAELIRLLDSMQCELEYRMTPLPIICDNVAKDATGCLHKVFSALSAELQSQTSPDAPTCMNFALSSVKDLPQEVYKALALLGNSLGKFDLNGQINEISSVKQHCMLILQQIRDNLDVRLRSYQTLGLCVGAGLVILLL